MVEVRNTAAIAESVGRWSPGDLAFIEKLEYQSLGNSASILIVGIMQCRDDAKSGWPSSVLPQFRVTMYFDGVRDLELKGFGQSAKQIMGFDIVDISDRGLEGVSLMVEDYENGDLQFNCRSVDILEVVRV